MIEAARRAEARSPTRPSRMRFRLTTLLGLVGVCAIGLAVYARYRASYSPWARAGGMIGWSQAAIESRLGPPTEAVQAELPDANGQRIRPAPPGPYRTLIYRTFDGTFVLWLSEGNGGYTCFRSKWAERNMYP